MTIALLRISAPQSPYRDCDIAVFEEAHPTAPARVICTDVATGLIVGSPSIAPDHRGQRSVNAGEVIRLIGGTYRLASIAVEIEARDLAKQSRRVSDELRLCRRLWRRKRRPSRC